MDTPATLQEGESPALLNVNITPGGLSVKSRQGYGLYKALTTSTSPVHGGHHFQDSTGNDIQIWGADVYHSIFNGLASVQIATMTFGSTIQCADSQGSAYCLTSNRDTALKTAGTAATTSFQAGIPLGTMLTFTPTRLAVSGVSGSPNTIHLSAANTFTTFTTGVTETDPFTEVIASPGSRITHIRYACGKILWWKDQSFGYLIGDDQFSIENVIVTPDIGTLDNSSDEYNGITYFRGQDNHIYQYDCSNVTRLSRAISPTVAASNRKKSNSWSQDTQSDFASGSITPTNYLSTSFEPGSVVTSSFTASEYSPASGWTSGTSSNMDVGTSSISLSRNTVGAIDNQGFESSLSGWTSAGTAWDVASSSAGTNCTLTPKNGSWFAYNTFQNFPTTERVRFQIIDLAGNTLSERTISGGTECGWTQYSIISSTNAGKRFKVRIVGSLGTTSLTSDSSYIFGGQLTFWQTYSVSQTGPPTLYRYAFDLIEGGSSTIASGSFTSQVYNTGFTSSTLMLNAVWTVDDSTPQFAVLHSTSLTGTWATLTTSTGTNAVARQFVKYVSTISAISSGDALTYISSAAFLSRSSGTYVSAVNNATSLSSWDILAVTDIGSSIAYYVRASTNHFTLTSTTVPWVAQTKNATVAASTGTYFQMRADFSVDSATSPPTISLFTFNWFEGNAADKAYVQYHDDMVWVSVSSGSSGVNNQIQRWDLLNETWLLDTIAVNGFVVDQGKLYFGDSSAGKVHLFGQGVYTDNGSSIYSFWKSKDLVGSDPWLNNEYIASDFIFKQSSNTVTATYTVDTSTPTERALDLYDPVRSVIRRSVNLPIGKLGNFYSLMISDTGTVPWEMMGSRTRYNAMPWKVQ